jgi:hypothetical protein
MVKWLKWNIELREGAAWLLAEPEKELAHHWERRSRIDRE